MEKKEYTFLINRKFKVVEKGGGDP